MRRTNWVKNWWVLICTRLTATVALSQTTIYKRIGSPSLPIGLLSVLVGNSESLHEIFAEDRGPEFVLRPEFDPIRDYIKSALVLPENLPDGQIAVDRRFVTEIPDDQQQLSFVDDDHAVVFYYLKPELIAFVTLYGSHLFLVQVAALEYDEREELFGHRFSIDRSGNEPLDLNAIAERILQKYPDRLGVTPEEAAKLLETLRSQKTTMAET